jgi:endonuclease YncB( thermonuclease family)
MPSVRSSLLIALLAAVLVALVPAAAEAKRGPCVIGVPGPGCDVWKGTVRSVNDGDTMDVDVDGDGTTRSRRIRFTGIQAMEQSVYSARHRQGDCHAVEATQRLEQLVRGSHRRVRLAAEDPESMSRNRLLRTVAVRSGGRWRDVGTIMLREGLALWWGSWAESAPNATYSVLAQKVNSWQRGVFDPDACGIGPSAASPLRVEVNWDADGDDTANPSGEWVRIRNLDPVNAVPLGGWYLRDSGLRRYTFPADAVIPPSSWVVVDIGRDGDERTVFAWGLRTPVFENATHDEDAMGDGAYLFDPLGNIRATMVYPCRYACTDPLLGAVGISANPDGRRESVTLTNLTGSPVDLDGHVLKSAPQSYHFGPGTVIPAGGSLRVQVVGDPEDDTALDKRWGFAKPILRDAVDKAALLSYTDISIACTAWGDQSC